MRNSFKCLESMEIYQLRYFIETAKRGALAPAAKILHVSISAVSRAISSLESHLDTKLFNRVGRRLKISGAGEAFRVQAEKIVALADESTQLFKDVPDQVNITVAGREILLDYFGIELFGDASAAKKISNTHFIDTTGKEALSKVKNGDADIAITVNPAPVGWLSKSIAELKFVTCVSSLHPLAKKSSIPVNELLKHFFVAPAGTVFGRIHQAISPDGWRDDVHPRKIKYTTDQMSIYATLIRKGLAVGYVPQYWVDKHDFNSLKISDCAFEANQNVYVSALKQTGKAVVENLYTF